MSRLSLVNMYLHNFASPNITEYDTLSSEDKWNDYFDIVLANPPFFSPKGGIKPHSRFSIKSSRAEVLFVEYIMEHLKPNGKAGIIVPEGIISQEDSIYKNLRKKLIKDFLIGVISLPPGVFLPYSGVKTSILILDKVLNKKRSNIFLATIENDGFDLGAKREKIEKNDLPEILEKICTGENNSKNYKTINKNKILAHPTFLLLASRYFENTKVNSRFNLVPIIDTFDVLTPPVKIKAKNFLKKGSIPIIDQSSKEISGYWNKNEDKIVLKHPVIVFGDHTKVVKYITYDFVAGADGIKILVPKSSILPKYLFYILKSVDLPDFGYSRHFKELKIKKIPLPKMDIQKEIIKEIEIYENKINNHKKEISLNMQIIENKICNLWKELS